MNFKSKYWDGELERLSNKDLVDELVSESMNGMEWDNTTRINQIRDELLKRLER